jgi:hypothetical protein
VAADITFRLGDRHRLHRSDARPTPERRHRITVSKPATPAQNGIYLPVGVTAAVLVLLAA